MSDLDHLRLLASAIAGRGVDVASADGPSWTDGMTVFLAADAGRADHVRALCVQASLLAAGSLAPEITANLKRPTTARRYLAVEGHRALAANEDVLPPLALGLIDRDIAATVADPEASLELARSRRVIEDPRRVFGEIRARSVAAVDERTPAPGTVPPTTTPADLTELEEDDRDEGDQFGNLLSSPVGGGGAVGRLLRRLLAPARERGGGGPPGADAPTHITGRPGAGRRIAVASGPARAFEETARFERQGAVYPEWDTHRRRYKPDWCTVIEDDPPVVTAVTPLAQDVALRRAVARLGVGLINCRRQRQGDDIDIDAAVEAHVDLAAGSPHDDDFYVGTLRRRRDLSVLVLLDISGSAGEAGTAGRTVHEHQRATAASLTATLHHLGDRVALYAFNSRGRKAVHVMRVKAFDDHLDGAAARRLAALTPGAYTRLGAAIRHGTSILEDRAGTPRRLLVVLSDGFAYDHGYEGSYAEGDARRALIEARRRGIGCVCLSVGADVEPAALRRVFGAAAHATVPRADELPTLIGPLFRREVERRSA